MLDPQYKLTCSLLVERDFVNCTLLCYFKNAVTVSESECNIDIQSSRTEALMSENKDGIQVLDILKQHRLMQRKLSNPFQRSFKSL